MNFFDHKNLGNHPLQLCPKVVKHPVYTRVCVCVCVCVCVHIKHGNEPSDFIKCVKFVDQVRYCQRMNKFSSPWELSLGWEGVKHVS